MNTKVIRLMYLSIMMIMTLLVGSNINGTEKIKAFAGADYSSQVEVNDWNIFDGNGDPLSGSNEATPQSRYQLWINWTLEPSGGQVLHEGDSFKIALPQNESSGYWSAAPSTYEDVKDSDGTILGKWRIASGHVEVVIGENAEGSSSINAQILTGKGALNNATLIGITQNVSLGNITKEIKFKQSPLLPLVVKDYKWFLMGSNSNITWGMLINSAGAKELSTQDWGVNFTEKKDVYIEDTLTDATVQNISIVSNLYYPIDLTSGEASRISHKITLTPKFKKVTQNASETYDQFKSRLGSLEYGVYDHGNDTYTVVVRMGNVGANNLKYSDINANFASEAATAAIDNGFYSEDDKEELEDYFNAVYGDENVISGNVPNYVVYINAKYDKVLEDSEKSNTTIITKGEEVIESTAKGPLQGNMGSASVSKNSAGIFLYDEDTNELLSDATFKVQLKNTITGEWEDYSIAGTLKTNAEGFAQTPSLGIGLYRFVEETPSSNEYDIPSSQGYDATLDKVVSAEFEIKATDVDGHKVPVSNVKYKFNVTYKKGDHGTFKDDVHNKVAINSSTPAFAGDKDSTGNPVGETGYIFDGWDKTVAAKVTETVVYTAKWKAADYPIKYELAGGTNNQDNPDTYQFGVGVESFKPATKEGHKFLGWFDSATTGDEITSISETDQGEKILYAHWEKEVYNIVYLPDGGINSPNNPDTYEYGVGVESFEDPTKEGHDFMGWFDNNDPGTPFTSISTTDTGDKELYAVWKEKIYNIDYELAGGVNDENNPDSYEYGIGVESFEPATKEGYTFLGWFDEENNDFITISTTDLGDKTLYAKWEANVYNINYELAGGVNDENNPDSYEYGIGVESFEPATKEGYTFLGWFDEEDNEFTSISETDTGDKTLFAKWEAIKYPIVYELDGGVNSSNNPNEYDYGKGIESFESATKEGYTFLGWFDEDGNEFTTISTTDIGEKTLYAQWKKVDKKDTDGSEDDNDGNDDNSGQPSDDDKDEDTDDDGKDKLPNTGMNTHLEGLMIALMSLTLLLFALRKVEKA